MKIDGQPFAPQPRFNWANMVKVASLIGIAPPQFWQLSFKEWCAIMNASNGTSGAMTRGDFEKLSARFADIKRDETDEQ